MVLSYQWKRIETYETPTKNLVKTQKLNLYANCYTIAFIISMNFYLKSKNLTMIIISQLH